MTVVLGRTFFPDSADELRLLVTSRGLEPVGLMQAKRAKPDPATFLGAGKIEELGQLAKEAQADCLVFDIALSAAQQRNIERAVNLPVLDRTQLILDIFRARAKSREGRLQVELAQLEHLSTRLVRGWTHLERQRGGLGKTGGPGEKQIELDRRMIGVRMKQLREQLKKLERQRGTQRRARERGDRLTVSLVGYTNAGKSTLFNQLTRAKSYAADQLFATLDPTLRNMVLPTVGKVVFADTVGFIRHLPHELVAAFRATLEETIQSDLLLHIIDIADPRLEDNIEAVNAVLGQIGADQVPTLLVFNKSDLKDDVAIGIVRNEEGRPVRVNVSAKTKAGLEDLLQAVAELLALDQCEFELKLGYQDGKLRASLYELKAITSSSYDEEGYEHLKVALKPQDCARIEKLSGGRLSACLVREHGAPLPWVQEEVFDFEDID